MKWIDVDDELPDECKMVLIRTNMQTIARYVVASWEPSQDCFIDRNEHAYIATHWMYINNPIKVK